MKKVISICMSMALVSGFAATAFAADTVTAEFDIKLVHTNDIHARVQENVSNDIIGMSKLKTLIDSYTADSDLDFVLDSGDFYHGQSFATLVEGTSVARLIAACGYDAMTAGNHDWNYGKDQLKTLEGISDCTILAGNVADEYGNPYFDNEYLIESVTKDGVELKVGLFGMIDPKIYNTTAPSNVEGLTFTDMTAYAQEAVTELEGMGCDVVIGLVHCIDPVSLAESVDGVDLWLAGHEHYDIDTVTNTPNGSLTRVVENNYYLYEVGLLEIKCTLDGSGDVQNLEITTQSVKYEDIKDLEGDMTVQALIDQINAEESGKLTEVVCSSPEDLDGVWEHTRTGETNLGRAITDAYLLETDADVAFENAGGIRASITAGDVTYGDIISVAPYGNYIVTKQVTGAKLLEILETSLAIEIECIAADLSGEYDAWPSNSGEHLQVGGMTVKYDLSKEQGSRIWYAEVQGKPLVKEQIYTIASNNFLVLSSTYPQLANAEEVGQYCACDEALIKYFSQSEDIVAKSVSVARMVSEAEPTDPSESSTEESNPSTEPTTGDTDDSKMILIIVLGVAAAVVVCCVIIGIVSKKKKP